MKFFLSLAFLSFYVLSFGQLKEFKLAQYDSLQNIQPKSSIVLIHTEWCKYCKQLKNTTLQKPSVKNKINEFGYYFNLNGEDKSSITINNIEFNYKPTCNNTGTHELAEELGSINGKLEYPTLVFLNEKHEIIHQVSGFITSEELIDILEKLK